MSVLSFFFIIVHSAANRSCDLRSFVFVYCIYIFFMSIINKFYLTRPFDVIETCVVKEPTREQRQPVSSVLLESKRDLVNFHRPKGIGTIEEVGVIPFEPRSPSKISRLDSLLPSDSFLHPFRPTLPRTCNSWL